MNVCFQIFLYYIIEIKAYIHKKFVLKSKQNKCRLVIKGKRI